MRRSDARISVLRAALLAWYRENARDLPWRRSKDPYTVWISEVMLQQTRVDTVIPYFERFLEQWPTAAALADASPDRVRAAWSGLGYYRRAQTMMDAARIIATEHGGQLPSDPEGLRALPGFGAYTTGAVASIAFDREVPAVDGNVMRVLARIAGIEGDVRKGEPNCEVWALAERLAPGEAPGDLTQALIELGALVCKRKPDCGRCPAAAECEARRAGRQNEIPPPAVRKAPKTVPLRALVLDDGARVLLARQPKGGLFAELWTPPFSEPEAWHDRLAALGVSEGELELEGAVSHRLTHRALEVEVWVGALPRVLPEGTIAAGLDELERYGLPTFASKLLRKGLRTAPARLPGRRTKPRSQAELPWGGS